MNDELLPERKPFWDAPTSGISNMKDRLAVDDDIFKKMLDESLSLMSDRKLRLFCCACCRRFWKRLSIDCQRLVELIEGYSDGVIDPQELRDARERIRPGSGSGSLDRACMWTAAIVDDWDCDRDEGWRDTIEGCITELVQRQTWWPSVNPRPPTWECLFAELAQYKFNQKNKDYLSCAKSELRQQMLLAQDILGDHRRVADSPILLLHNTVQSATVISIASTIYQHYWFVGLPVLADSLEEAGCSDSSVLAHCRSTNEHARGCWVLDLLLGKH